MKWGASRGDHHCMALSRSKMPSMQGKRVGRTWPYSCFCLWQTGHCTLPLMNGQTTLNIFEVWSIFDGQVGKCHMGWRLRCKIFRGWLNQNVIWELGHRWHVWAKSRCTNVQHVVHTLMGPPFNWTTPNECYQRQP